MELLMARIQTLASISRNSSTRAGKAPVYDCPKCNDKTFIIRPDGRSAYDCSCKERKQYERLLKASGIHKAFKEKRFSNFRVEKKPPVIKEAKNMAYKYALGFSTNQHKGHNSLTLLGEIGSGKTHLTMAIANHLLEQNIGVYYFQYRESITKLKQNIRDVEYYQREMNTFKRAKVLLIDDLFKGRISESDLNIMFEIINYRYLNRKAIMVSSELTIEDLLRIDEAIGSRILEMSKGHFLELQGKGLNYRVHC